MSTSPLASNKRKLSDITSDAIEGGSLNGVNVASCGVLVYDEDNRGSYYLSPATLKKMVEAHGGRLQSGRTPRAHEPPRSALACEARPARCLCPS